jgi:signal transduction histidine kinase
LLAYVYGKGLYSFDKKWRLLSLSDASQKFKFARKIYITSQGDTLISYNSGLCRLNNNRIGSLPAHLSVLEKVNVLCFAEDEKQRLWLGTENGVYRTDGGNVMRFGSRRGFTDNSVNDIYRDVENNLWFATDADGIYKFRENTFTYYDKTSGLANTIVMGVVQTSDRRIYAGGYGGGLYMIDQSGDLEPASSKGNLPSDCKINSLYADDKNNVWIATLGKGIYKYNIAEGFKKIDPRDPSAGIRGATCFLKDGRGNLMIGGNQGIIVMNGRAEFSRINLPGVLVTSLKMFGNSVLAGTSSGVFIVDPDYKISPFHPGKLANASVLCMAVGEANIWLGTTDKGVLNYNFKTGQLYNYNTGDGLPSNFIYSINITKRHKVWIGSGFGITNLQADPAGKIFAIKNYGRSEGLLGMECSHNCLLRAADSSLWFGTTKGLFHFNPLTGLTEKTQPLVLLKSVKLYSSEITDSSLFNGMGRFMVPEGLRLHSKQNHLTFELASIYFTNPEDVLFQYKLEGIDKDFTTSSNPFIIYPALPPGKYTLIVKGITKSGIRSTNAIAYAFRIEKAFYQTGLFQGLLIITLIATGALLTYLLSRGRQRRRLRAKEQVARIREEEFVKLRQRTAEDFHDEMGNSLTRISVLTDILKAKVNGKEQEVTQLVQQIKENTTALYNGSRDIIWSLNSQNDGVFEIAGHLREIGVGLFENTKIEFELHHNIDPLNALKLKLDYSRNLTMVFKEAYSNIVKHSGASRVVVEIILRAGKTIDIAITDNGKGFEPGRSGGGNGIRNMNNRIQRMHGTFTVNSSINKGTVIEIFLSDIFPIE